MTGSSLWLRRGTTPVPFSSGSSPFLIGEGTDASQLVSVRCRIVPLEMEIRALLDTGAAWTVIGADLADELLPHIDIDRSFSLSTRYGTLKSHLGKIDIELMADHGDSLNVSASVALTPEFPQPLVLGYRGLLEHVRFGLDPATKPDAESWFYFGTAAVQ